MWVSRKEFCTIAVECSCAITSQGIWLRRWIVTRRMIARICDQVLVNIYQNVAVVFCATENELKGNGNY
jgi:hypothetical protein